MFPGDGLMPGNYASIVFTADPQGQLSRPQPEWAWFTGQTWEEYHGNGWMDAVHPDDRMRVLREWRDSVRKNRVHGLQVRVWHAASGDYHQCVVRAVPVIEPDGNAREWIGVVSDIQHAISADDELRKTRQRLDLMFDQSIVGMSHCDLNGTLTLANQRFCEIVGRPMEEVLGMNARQLTHLDDIGREDVIRAYSMGLGKGYEIQKRYVRPDGSIVWVRNYVSIIRDEQGKPQFSAALTQDITLQRAAEEQRVLLTQRERTAREEADKANRTKDEFIAALSHELRTPLTPVLMTASALEQDDALPQGVRDELSTIRRNVELEARLIDDLLDLTRISRGKMNLFTEVIDIHGIVSDTIGIIRSEAEEGEVSVELELEASRPCVIGDPARLRQVVWNLLKNAIKFSNRGGRVTVRTFNLGSNMVRLEVEDGGVGISDSTLQRIFNAFEQGPHRRRFGGLGLGLAICKAVVDAHGGRITAESEGEGRGARFSVDLPVTEHDPGAEEPEAKEQGTNGEGLRVLLVEDHAQTLDLLSRLLTRRGYQTTEASSVEEALAKAKEEPFDLLISDIGLPDGTGFDVMRELSRHSSLKGIALSGFGMEEDTAKARAAGFSRHLVKPVSVDQLVAAIDEVVR